MQNQCATTPADRLPASLSPIQQVRAGRLPRRLLQLILGLWLYGASMAMMLRANLGLAPWDVLHQGLAERLPLSFGTIVIAVSVLVLLLWIPLRQWPGLGTLTNAVLIGIAVDATLPHLPSLDSIAARIALLAAGIVLNGLAGALYIGSQFGPGPRDGLMTGLARRTGGSLRLIRTALEVGVLLLGLALGGSIGLGTIAYAFGIGPIVHFALPKLTVKLPSAPGGDRGLNPSCRT